MSTNDWRTTVNELLKVETPAPDATNNPARPAAPAQVQNAPAKDTTATP